MIRRGTFHCVDDLERAIYQWLANWNHEPKPFAWKATADVILDKVRSYKEGYCKELARTGDGDRASGLVPIKPSGVPYERMKPADLVIVDLEGKPVEGKLRPSSDLPTHLVLYRAYRTHRHWQHCRRVC